jgi:hypothetical protein
MPSVGLRGGIVKDRNGYTKPVPRGNFKAAAKAESQAMATGKILIALSFWEGDRASAEKLARFLADLEPSHTDKADFLLVNRFDCPPLDPNVLGLTRKFNTFTHTTPKILTGWPNGCNAMAMAMLSWVCQRVESKKIPSYKAIFNCEADGGPVSVDWIAKMSAAWDSVNQKRKVVLAGPMVPAPQQHINANALLSGDPSFLRWFTAGGPMQALQGGGWDYLLADTFKHMGWADIPQMKSYYNSANFTVEQYLQMQRENVIWCHGDKSNALVDLGRIWLIGGQNAIIL